MPAEIGIMNGGRVKKMSSKTGEPRCVQLQKREGGLGVTQQFS